MIRNLKEYTMSKLLKLLVAGALAFALGACADDDDGLALDLDTLQAETEGGIFQAAPMPNTFVADVDEDLYIGISLEEDDVTVYLCDGERVGVWLTGEVDDEGLAELGSFEEGAYVQLGVDDDLVSGSVTVAGALGAHRFEATPANGDAGLYRAEETFEGEDYVGGWVVLEDGRQKGTCVICWICSPRGGICCGPCPQVK